MFRLFLAALVHTFHMIWMARNNLCFGNDKTHLHAEKSKIVSSMALSGNIYNGNCIPLDTSLLENFMVSPTFRHFKSIIHVWWKPPTSN